MTIFPKQFYNYKIQKYSKRDISQQVFNFQLFNNKNNF